MIPVTKPFLPPQQEYQDLLDGIWQRQWLTNMGPLANELEEKLQKHLSVSNTLFVTNGTIALQMALKALNITGEVITTPFSFIATTSSIVWEGCTPVFVDIDAQSLNIDADKIEAAITSKTQAILATHVYGNPCDVEKIQQIADKHNLKVIYDAAHAFGVKVHGRSIFEYGDISTCSLHATKLYHSIEGGLIMAKDETIFKKLKSMRNFGFAGSEAFDELGINGKNSEFHAAMGLTNLNYVDKIHQKRKALTEAYDKGLTGFTAYKPQWHSKATLNYAYYPIILKNEEMLLKTLKKLKENNIQARRYFYPSLANSVPYLRTQSFKVADAIAKRVVCLPLYYDLDEGEVEKIIGLIN
ncbi:DegT/DnrJ/EryC1/StrS family aminotransferase [Sinomicrobium weinanense]|uniref:DegT/DnrJ/EryC1/StrS family aminotransferase n=1 Tax=Sinomicrobium weinanense TaxID=2842200 RepID=A0A926JW59_9FLAO|nr:DegT/DnrJ/EryC1/StrS family aminotransferase [Sinomicrobium weinanense]MBC9798481.1 DegT/DnrJ/EryC1/StrS family aminotransferase [Sinomicrobium weinanense]MBU3123718.1 DegT/DnrJ/EryC1/StrS family aminotransferase [Sinomicrobium weinanense]